MRKAIVFLSIFVLAALVLSPTLAQDATPEPVGLRPDAPTYALHGPYWVGTRDLVIEPESERPLPATLWYPALNPEGVAEAVTHNISAGPEVGAVPFLGHAIADAAPNTEAAPYPLVIFSPGSGAPPHDYLNIIEHLASQGFVVISVSHPGNAFEDFVASLASEEGMETFLKNDSLHNILRPLDTQQEIRAAEDLTAAGGMLEGMIDTERIAIAGVSFGGYDAMVAGGACIHFSAFKKWCVDNTEKPIANAFCYASEYEAEQASIAGVEVGTESLWPPMGDPRIRAVVSLSMGFNPIFGSDGLKSLNVPTMVVLGSADTELPAGDELTQQMYDEIGSDNKTLILFQNAGHMIPNIKCEDIPWAVAWGVSAYCTDPVWDMDRAHDLINHFTTAFLLDTLKGDQAAHAALLAENVSFPGITYETTMK